MLRGALLAGVWFLGLAAVLFGAAGRLDWPMAWAYLLLNAVAAVVILVFGDPEMIRVRCHREPGAKRWDMALAAVSFLWFCPATLIVAGLDYGRFHWSPPLPIPVEVLALVVLALATAFGCWAMVTNRFFAKFLRIQTERGHHVVTHGPYAFVRHPAYAGAVVGYTALPLALGSLWALIPAVVGLCLLVLRTFLEDQTLRKELNGYREYASRVRWRLLPGIW